MKASAQILPKIKTGKKWKLDMGQMSSGTLNLKLPKLYTLLTFTN